MIDNEIDFSLYGVLNKKFKPLSKYSFLNLKYVLIAFFTITILLFNAPYIYIFIFTSNYSYKLSISIHQKNPFPYTYHQFFNSSFNQLIVNSGILLSIKASSPFISTALSIILNILINMLQMEVSLYPAISAEESPHEYFRLQ